MSLNHAIQLFTPITLAQMDKVKLMNRTDRKFWFNIDHLEQILLDVKEHYYILEIDGERNMPYSTTYYDTAADQMYINHHRGKLNRFKIRRRSYLSSQSSFLEVKFKSNKGRTIKNRIAVPFSQSSFSTEEQAFIAKRTPYSTDELCETLTNRFRRLMLVSKTMNERCTIDQKLNFFSSGTQASLEQLVVVEVKSEGRAPSPIITSMNSRRLKPSGFSKYCMGRSITDPTLRSSLFKSKHRLIEKHIDCNIDKLLKPCDNYDA